MDELVRGQIKSNQCLFHHIFTINPAKWKKKKKKKEKEKKKMWWGHLKKTLGLILRGSLIDRWEFNWLGETVLQWQILKEDKMGEKIGTHKFCSSSVPPEYVPGAKPLVCISLKGVWQF